MKKTLIRMIFIWIFVLAAAFSAFASDGLQVHFIDVGQGDACLITCDGHALMIDGGNSSDSQLIYSYLRKQGISFLDYIVATHDDADHVGGLSAAVSYAGTNIGQVFAPCTDSEKERFQTFRKKLAENGKSITVPGDEASYKLGGAEVQFLTVPASGDNYSLVLRLTYGNHSFLFMGDAEEWQEKDLLNTGQVESTVLKVGHHGSQTSSCNLFLKAVNPAYAVISVGADNPYGHPAEDVLSRLRDCGASVLRTDLNGTVIFSSDGDRISVEVQKGTLSAPDSLPGTEPEGKAPEETDPETDPETKQTASNYVLNINTKKFHLPGCASVGEMREKNKKEVCETREDIIAQGYVPCKRCNP